MDNVQRILRSAATSFHGVYWHQVRIELEIVVDNLCLHQFVLYVHAVYVLGQFYREGE